jgi:hypothetical protein
MDDLSIACQTGLADCLLLGPVTVITSALLGVVHSVSIPLLLAERAVLLCPAFPGLLGDMCIDRILLLLGTSPFCLVLAGGLLNELDFSFNVLQYQQ